MCPELLSSPAPRSQWRFTNHAPAAARPLADSPSGPEEVRLPGGPILASFHGYQGKALALPASMSCDEGVFLLTRENGNRQRVLLRRHRAAITLAIGAGR